MYTLAAAVPTFLAVSLIPGLCMTMAMALGMRIGVRRTLWMILGELAGLSVVATLSILGVAALITAYPAVYQVAKWLGAAYLVYYGLRLWLDSPGEADLERANVQAVSASSLIRQGITAAVANPKAWILYASLFPPFLDPAQPLAPQLFALLFVFLAIEFGCLLAYASGGQALRQMLMRGRAARAVHLAAGCFIIFIAGSLVL